MFLLQIAVHRFVRTIANKMKIGKKLNCKKIKKKKKCNSKTKAGPLAEEFCPVLCKLLKLHIIYTYMGQSSREIGFVAQPVHSDVKYNQNKNK
jgi:hypothetical protein